MGRTPQPSVHKHRHHGRTQHNTMAPYLSLRSRVALKRTVDNCLLHDPHSICRFFVTMSASVPSLQHESKVLLFRLMSESATEDELIGFGSPVGNLVGLRFLTRQRALVMMDYIASTRRLLEHLNDQTKVEYSRFAELRAHEDKEVSRFPCRTLANLSYLL